MRALVGTEVLFAAAACIIVIAGWVHWRIDRVAALVVLGLSAVALGCIYLAYEVWPVEQWRQGNLARTLLIFALPAVAAIGILAMTRRNADSHANTGSNANADSRGNPGDPGRNVPVARLRMAVFIACLWLGPALVVYVSQLRPVTGEPGAFSAVPDRALTNLTWWALSSVALYVSIPIAYAIYTHTSVRSFGLSLGFIRTEGALFLLAAPVIVAVVWLASADLRFQQVYPFYKMAPDDADGLGKLVVFELLYGLSFVALEFFFRGFLVLAGEPILGAHSVAIMAFSYCLIHLGKPMPECAASLVGGLILGFVALRLRTIAVGVAAHLALAWGVDVAVLSRLS